MPMVVRCIEVAELPMLAWCARVDRDSDTVAVVHGRGVETHPRGFMEAAWDGDFASRNLAGATVVCGTGAWLEDSRISFVASTDLSGPIFSIAKPACLYVSNSPAFVSAAAGEEPDEIYPFYPYDLTRIYRRGLACQGGRVRLSSAARLGVHYRTVMSVDRGGTATFAPHRLCEAPTDYASYKALLVDGTSKVVSNAADPGRRRHYRSLAALSRGYDSTATAAIARASGCTDALSFVDSRIEDPQADCGAQNARDLGMNCAVYDRWRYLELGGREVEFGYGAVGSAVTLAAAEALLPGRLLINGEAGGSVWTPRHVKYGNDLAHPWIRYAAGLSPIEFRLRVGYLMFAPACIAARHNQAICDIAMSDAMRPWSIGGDYDRPIARRIGEEAGLARERFGTRKLATGHTQFVYRGRFSAEGLTDYRRFLAQSHAGIAPEIYRYWRTRVERRHRLWASLESERSGDDPDGLASVRFPPPLRIPWDFMFTFQWTVASLRRRYACASEDVVGFGAAGSAIHAA